MEHADISLENRMQFFENQIISRERELNFLRDELAEKRKIIENLSKPHTDKEIHLNNQIELLKKKVTDVNEKLLEMTNVLENADKKLQEMEEQNKSFNEEINVLKEKKILLENKFKKQLNNIRKRRLLRLLVTTIIAIIFGLLPLFLLTGVPILERIIGSKKLEEIKSNIEIKPSIEENLTLNNVNKYNEILDMPVINPITNPIIENKINENNSKIIPKNTENWINYFKNIYINSNTNSSFNSITYNDTNNFIPIIRAQYKDYLLNKTTISDFEKNGLRDSLYILFSENNELNVENFEYFHKLSLEKSNVNAINSCYKNVNLEHNITRVFIIIDENNFSEKCMENLNLFFENKQNLITTNIILLSDTAKFFATNTWHQNLYSVQTLNNKWLNNFQHEYNYENKALLLLRLGTLYLVEQEIRVKYLLKQGMAEYDELWNGNISFLPDNLPVGELKAFRFFETTKSISGKFATIVPKESDNLLSIAGTKKELKFLKLIK